MPFINITQPNQTREGIIPQIFEKAMRACCRGEFQIDYDQQFETQGQVLEILKNFTIHFALPIQKDHRSKKHLHNPFVSIGKYPCWYTTLFQRLFNVIWTLWTLDGSCLDVVCRLG